MTYFFTADEHYGHSNIIKYCNRPFEDVQDMNEELIKRHNAIVKEHDQVIHVGDFALLPTNGAAYIISQLHGDHVFLQGSHDKWAHNLGFLWEHKFEEELYIVACHYPMLSWPRSHHGSFLLHGHTHGRLKAYPGILDVGVDCWDYAPVPLEEIRRNLWK